MTQTEKEQIKQLVEQRITGLKISQSNAATRIGLSKPMITYLLKGEWEKLSDKTWQIFADWVELKQVEWQTVETENYKMMHELLADAQEYANVYAIIGEAGSSKSHSINAYKKEAGNVYAVECGDYFNKRIFLGELLTAMGIDSSGYSISEMMEAIVKTCIKNEESLIVLDEFDKVSDQILQFFITFYNKLHGRCGIVITATDHLQKRIIRGLRINKKGYKEVYSRIGKKFIELAPVSPMDIRCICESNGVNDPKEIDRIVNDSDLDLRRVERLVHGYKKKKRKQDAQKGGAE